MAPSPTKPHRAVQRIQVGTLRFANVTSAHDSKAVAGLSTGITDPLFGISITGAGGPANSPLAQFVPAPFTELDTELLRCCLDALPSLVFFFGAYAFDLIEASDGVAHMRGVLKRFLTLPGKREVTLAQVVALFGIEFCHVISPVVLMDASTQTKARLTSDF
ncbi:hypothetical protein [Rhodanobacter sp. MP7CTX1]|uniref:hypothetical protein n=1 Tax=Rhodanobacter sp. MP7CTX1 TaxID=2723084 RepID=UPI001611FFFD|nr:hypothetical protein [Rhodanobacter sp. MP7CTX1]MBB6186120.1 phage-related minor tail protein [Rhodanobacter sp. MP7CTX1]